MSVNDLPVDYYSSANGWMTGFIFNAWLSKWNCKLARENCHILLFVDNAPSHVVETYSNIQIQFLPPNTTAKLQPLDQGVLRLVKCAYRSSLSDMYLDGIENNEHAKAIMKRFDIKVTCDLVCAAWKSIKATTIQSCFAKAGFMYHVPSDPQELPTSQPDRNVWENIQSALNVRVDFETYATADDSIESSQHLSEEEIVQAVLLDNREHTEEVIGEESDTKEDLQEPAQIINSCQESLNAVQMLRTYFQKNGIDSNSLDTIEKQLVAHKLSKNKSQSSIKSFLTR